MILSIPPRDSFDVEPGRYRATCIDTKEVVKQTRKGSERQLRLVWELQIPLDDDNENDVRYLAGKNYEPTLTKNSQLRNDLQSWFGHEFKPSKFDTATLKGKEATITVQHIENEGWPKPYCLVAKVEPPESPDDHGEARSISPRMVCG